MKTPEQAWADIRPTLFLSDIARQLQPPLTRAAISAWTRVPAERVIEVARIIEEPPARLRPDLYPPPDPWSGIMKQKE